MPDPFELEELADADLDIQGRLDAQDADPGDEVESRQDRRNARVEEYQKKIEALEASQNQLLGRLEEIGKRSAEPEPPPVEPQELVRRVEAHFQPQIDRAMEERDNAGTALIALQKGEAPQAEIDVAMRRYRQAELNLVDMAAQRRNAINYAGQPQPDPQSQRQSELQAQLRSQYPDVFSNNHASTEFYAQLLRKSKGDQKFKPSQQDIQEAVELARREAGIGSLSPTEHQRRATTGMPAGHAGQGGGGSQRPLTMLDRKIMALTYGDYEPDPRKQEALYRKEVLSQMDRG